MDPEKGQAGKAAYGAYKSAVEDVAQSQPVLADKFTLAKQTYGMLEPVIDAAEKRALQLQQSPIGGLLDTTSMIGGQMAGDITGGVAATAARKLISPRVASSAAVTMDMMSKILKAAPEKLGKYGPVMHNAYSRGPVAASATDYILSQTDPEYRKMKLGLDDER
jgi:hypothetical protein